MGPWGDLSHNIKISRNRSLVTVHAFCYRSHMESPKCKACGHKHSGPCYPNCLECFSKKGRKSATKGLQKSPLPAEIEGKELPGGSLSGLYPEKKSEDSDAGRVPVIITTGARAGEEVLEPDICPQCGSNLKARRKDRERRRKWMRKQRSEEKGDG